MFNTSPRAILDCAFFAKYFFSTFPRVSEGKTHFAPISGKVKSGKQGDIISSSGCFFSPLLLT